MSALITHGELAKDSLLLKLAVEYFDFDPSPLLRSQDILIYFSRARWDETYDQFQGNNFHDVVFLPIGGAGGDSLAGHWYEVAKLRHYLLDPLRFMNPRPVSFYARFGLSLGVTPNAVQFGAHPETRLRFAVPPGTRHLRTAAGLNPAAYENLPEDQSSDGIEIDVTLLQKGTPDRVIYSRYLNPRENPQDRGAVPIDIHFEMPVGAELEIAVTAGPNNIDRRDWAYLGALTIE